jgi:hypothetical protein
LQNESKGTKGMTTPIYYFVFQDTVIPVDGSMIIARVQGNVIIKYDHQESCLICYIDKNNTSQKSVVTKIQNQVLINEQLLDGGIKQIKFGDTLKVDGSEYKLYETYEEAYSKVSKHNRRKYKRPKNAYALSNFLNFYCAPPWALSFYFGMFIILLFKYLPNLSLVTPEELGFIGTIYKENILTDFLIAAALVWVSCLLHSFFMYMYFNRNAVRKSAATFTFLCATISLMFLMSSSLRQIKKYVEIRSNIWNRQQPLTEKSINIIKNLFEEKSDILKSYEVIKPMLAEAELVALKKDLDRNVKKLDSDIKLHLEVSKK